MTAVERFRTLATEERFKGWPVIGEPELGSKIPFFGQILNYELHTGNGIEKYTSLIRSFGWSVCFGVTPDRELISLCQWKPGLNQASWELPPGGIGKVPSDTPIEEIAEKTKGAYLKETGYQVGKMDYLGHFLVETGKYRGAGPDDHGLKAHMFLSEDLTKVSDARSPNPNEIIETVMVPLDQIREVIESGLLVEETTTNCTFRALIKLGMLQWK